MKIACISTSNTKLMGHNSASTKVCELIKDIIYEEYDINADIEVIPLVNYDLKPCIFCGSCHKTSSCSYDEAFNSLFSRMSEADALFFVVPHYSPIPAKLLLVFEKLNEIAYSNWLNDPAYVSPFTGKPAGVIGHGGMVGRGEVLLYYHDKLITPVANTLKALSFHVVGHSELYPNGAPFGLKDEKCLKEVENSVFPEVIQDYTLIEGRIKPIIENVIRETEGGKNYDRI